MVKLRRIALVVLAVGALATTVILTSTPADGQIKPRGQKQPAKLKQVVQLKQVQLQPGPPGQPPGPDKTPPPPTNTLFSVFTPITHPKHKGFIAAVTDARDQEDWKTVCVEAQEKILDRDEDFYVQLSYVDPKTMRKGSRSVSIKFEANRIIGSMPEDGLNLYQGIHGDKAKARLDEAKKTGSKEILAEVAMRYLHTKAGAEANDLLGTYHLDRGEYFMAALRFDSLLSLKSERTKLSDLTLFKAALAFRRAGDSAKFKTAWDRLEPELKKNGGLKLDKGLISAQQLEKLLNEVPAPQLNSPYDWPVYLGNLTHTAQASGSPPLLDEKIWERSLYKESEDDVDTKETQKWVGDALKAQEKGVNVPTLPGFFPIAVDGTLIFRSYTTVTGIALKDLKDKDGKVVIKAGEVEWKATVLPGSLGWILADKDIRYSIQTWLGNYNQHQGYLPMVFENSQVGTMTSDSNNVYLVDDLAIPPPPIYSLNAGGPWNPGTQVIQGMVRNLVVENTLYAFQLHTGKLAWQIPDAKKDHEEFKNSHFLGAPINVGGKLYALSEKNDGDLRLITIDPKEGKLLHPAQSLGTVQDGHRFTQDFNRRIHTVHLAYGEGILVCPTNAGEILGVDLLSGTFAWTYSYREKNITPQAKSQNPWGGPKQMPPFSPVSWKVSAPIITEGKVVFTCVDGSSVHCLNLRDGMPIWTTSQLQDDLYLAGVYNGKVLIVGKTYVRAVSLQDGNREVWRVSIGSVPSGHGVAAKGIYYLPLKKAEILAIDMDKGIIKAHNRSRSGNASDPGNLVFYEGAVISQTPTEIIAYPQLAAKLLETDQLVKKNPDDLEKRAYLGELRLANGEIQKAVDDLRLVLSKKPPQKILPRTQKKLFEAFSELFENDFNNASAKYLNEFKDLCKVPDAPREEQLREAKYLRLVGQGREKQGDLVAAFQAYSAFGNLEIMKEEGVSPSDDPVHKVPTEVWIKGRIAAMIARATPSQRKPLEEEIDKQWKTAQKEGTEEGVRKFVAMFDVPFKVGREARLELANKLLSKEDKAPVLLEAELLLYQLRVPWLKNDPESGGRALEALARLEASRGTDAATKWAAGYYRLLKEEFPNTPVVGSKTGLDLYKEAKSDKRILAHLKDAEGQWRKGTIYARNIGTKEDVEGVAGFPFEPDPEAEPSIVFARHRLSFEHAASRLYITDRQTNKGWSLVLKGLPNTPQYYQNVYSSANADAPYNARAKYRIFQSKGNLVVVQLGGHVFAVDIGTREIKWDYDLLDKINAQQQQMLVDEEGRLEIAGWGPFVGNFRKKVGCVAAVQASYVCLQTQKGLVVVEPLTGKELWSKTDISPRAWIFGDDQHIYIVDASENGVLGTGRVLRASDGVLVDAPNFGDKYARRIRILGRTILHREVEKNKSMTLKLTDIITGKDLWSQSFDARAVYLKTDDPYLTGVLEPDGTVLAYDLHTFKEVFRTNVVKGRVTNNDVAEVREPLLQEERSQNPPPRPLLVRDRDHYYIALSKPVDPGVVLGGVVANNFKGNMVRCARVNGWFMAFDHKGAFKWHSIDPILNQMIVLEEFENMPVILFSARYNEKMAGGGGGPSQRSVASTMSLNRRNGKLVLDPRVSPEQGPQFYAMTINPQEGTIDLFGNDRSIQHFVE
jgi:outer membrane protein assembly factor BamB